MIRYIVGQRRRARGQRSLPTHDEILAHRAAQAAAAVAVPPPALQQEPPARKGALHSMNPVAAEFHPATKAQTPPAVPPAAAPSAPERTYEDAERWLRSTQNPNAGLAAIPQVWVNVTDLYVFPIRVESFFKEHYMNKPAFRLKYDYFPGFKVCRLFCLCSAWSFTGSVLSSHPRVPGHESCVVCRRQYKPAAGLRLHWCFT